MSSTHSHPVSDEAPITHPEEFRWNYDIRIGDKFSCQGNIRLTPAGVATAGIAVAGVLVALAFLRRSGKNCR